MTQGAKNFNPQVHSHVMYIEGVPDLLAPIYHIDLGPAKDEASSILEKTPGAKCYIFQIRCVMESKVQIESKDFMK